MQNRRYDENVRVALLSGHGLSGGLSIYRAISRLWRVGPEGSGTAISTPNALLTQINVPSRRMRTLYAPQTCIAREMTGYERQPRQNA